MFDIFSSPYGLAVLLDTANRLLVRSLYDRLAAVGYADIHLTHGIVLHLLIPGGATVTELATRLEVTKQAVSQVVIYLEQCGYVVRQPHPHDRRGKIVVLTKRGRDCIRATEAVLAELEKDWSARVGAECMQHLRSDLYHFVQALGDGSLLEMKENALRLHTEEKEAT
ncbi:MAG: MarR family transcriptional regulator [Chloroflexi bacterium]|nr:MarR family transcriptional regulator [Chloroflexota bacterium]